MEAKRVIRQDIYFDSRRPHGPLCGDDWCEHGNKWVQFHSKFSSGYELGMQLSALNRSEQDNRHVITMELTGMKQDHGYNAIAVVMDAYDHTGSNEMFREGSAEDFDKHTLTLYSQFECAWPNTRLTLVIDPSLAKVVTYIEPCECPGETCSHPLSLGKRKRYEAEEEHKPGLDALPFLVRPSDQNAWTDLGDGLKVRSHDAEWLRTTGVPSVGVRMCGGYDNRVTIVAPSSRVLDALDADDIPKSASGIIVYA